MGTGEGYWSIFSFCKEEERGEEGVEEGVFIDGRRPVSIGD